MKALVSKREELLIIMPEALSINQNDLDEVGGHFGEMVGADLSVANRLMDLPITLSAYCAFIYENDFRYLNF